MMMMMMTINEKVLCSYLTSKCRLGNDAAEQKIINYEGDDDGEDDDDHSFDDLDDNFDNDDDDLDGDVDDVDDRGRWSGLPDIARGKKDKYLKIVHFINSSVDGDAGDDTFTFIFTIKR